MERADRVRRREVPGPDHGPDDVRARRGASAGLGDAVEPEDGVRTGATDGGDDGGRPARGGDDHLPDLLGTAAERLAEEEFDRSIQAGNMFVRRELSAELDAAADGTHWGFFRECVDEGLAGREEALRELTEADEQAAFGSRPATEHEAERALELSGELTGVTVPERP